MMPRRIGFASTSGRGLALSLAWLFGLGAGRGPGPAQGDAGLRAVSRRRAGRSPGPSSSATLSVTWSDGGKAFEYRKDGKTYRYDIAAEGRGGQAGHGRRAGPARPGRPGRGGGPERGRQFARSPRPTARSRRSTATATSGSATPTALIEMAVTTDGSEKDRIKNGTASWVYGEELDQNTAIWWSPDGKKLAFYRFDESKVTDYFLQLDQTKVQDKLDVEPYPKAGRPTRSSTCSSTTSKPKKTTKVDVRDGKPFDDDVRRPLRLRRRAGRPTARSSCSTGPTAARTSWSSPPPTPRPASAASSSARSGRRAGSRTTPRSGSSRTASGSSGPPSATGWKNFYLYDLDGKLLATRHRQRVRGRPDRPGRRGGRRPLLHGPRRRQPDEAPAPPGRLDGTGDRRLTDPAFHHTVDVAPDGEHFIDVAQTHDTPARRPGWSTPTARSIETLAESDLSKFDALGPEAGRAAHVQGGRRQDRAVRPAPQAVGLRPEQEVPAAGLRLRRPGDERGPRDLRHAQPADRVRLPRRRVRLPERRGPGQEVPRRDLPEARRGRDRRPGGRGQVAPRPALCRQGAGRDLRHVLRRLRLGPLPAPPPRRLPGRLRRRRR